ncbi:unnamed protein product [Owenia fusiformis]|uniref:VWFD domain-containing protein n=1 Tax=Owenia fusiformis TaxID=6347 RepID=A0A8S4PHL5_OWEFU|nr:unnamed protein product [Owenia fusiformis]
MYASRAKTFLIEATTMQLAFFALAVVICLPLAEGQRRPRNCFWQPWSPYVKCTCCNKYDGRTCEKYCLRYRNKIPAGRGGRDCIGRSVEYTKIKCSCRRSCGLPPKQCRGHGEVHYHSFDGLYYHFQGVCKYTLVEDTIGFFKILVKNRQWPFASDTSATKYVELHMPLAEDGEQTIRLLGPSLEQIQVGPDESALSDVGVFFSNSLYTIQKVGDVMTFESGVLGLRVEFEMVRWTTPPANFPGYGDVTVTLGTQWMADVDGLCQNYNGDVSDDVEDGLSYKVFDSEDEDCDDFPSESDDKCSRSRRAKRAATKFCKSVPTIISRDAIDKMPPQDFKGWMGDCVIDFCSSTNMRCAITTFFAGFVRTFGVDPKGWREKFDCPMTCGVNEVFLYGGQACEAHCANERVTWCTKRPRDGCYCQKGYIRCNGRCIRNLRG